MDNQRTNVTSSSSSQQETYTESEIKQNQITFLKAHKQEIKDYILAGVPKDIAAQVTDIQVDYDSLEDQFDEGAAGFGTTGDYRGTDTILKISYSNPNFPIQGGFTTWFDNYKYPASAEIGGTIISIPIDGTRDNSWIDSNNQLMIGGKSNGGS